MCSFCRKLVSVTETHLKRALCSACVLLNQVTGDSPPVGMELSLPLSAFHTPRQPQATGLTTNLQSNGQVGNFRCDVSLQSRTGRLQLNFWHPTPLITFCYSSSTLACCWDTPLFWVLSPKLLHDFLWEMPLKHNLREKLFKQRSSNEPLGWPDLLQGHRWIYLFIYLF